MSLFIPIFYMEHEIGGNLKFYCHYHGDSRESLFLTLFSIWEQIFNLWLWEFFLGNFCYLAHQIANSWDDSFDPITFSHSVPLQQSPNNAFDLNKHVDTWLWYKSKSLSWNVWEFIRMCVRRLSTDSFSQWDIYWEKTHHLMYVSR